MRSPLSARAPSPSEGLGSVTRPARWAERRGGRAATAILLTGAGASETLEPLKRCFATLLPESDVLPFVGPDRAALVRQMFVEVKAHAYVVADEIRDSVAVAQAVAMVERDGADLVVVSGPPGSDLGDRFLALALDYLFGCGAGPVDAVAVACSRGFARTYRGDGTARDLALHALRRRMRLAEVRISRLADPVRDVRPARTLRGWLALASLIARLFAEERPRRTFGLAGLAAISAGIGAATPAVRIHDWHAALLPGWDAILPLGLTGAGVGAVAAGLLLDAMVQARQDVSRIGSAAISGRPADQSSVS